MTSTTTRLYTDNAEDRSDTYVVDAATLARLLAIVNAAGALAEADRGSVFAWRVAYEKLLEEVRR